MSPAASACLFPYAPQPLPLLTLFLFSFFTSPIFPPLPLFFYRREKTPPLSLVSQLILTPGYQPADERWGTVLLLYMHPTTPCCLLQSGKQHPPEKRGKNEIYSSFILTDTAALTHTMVCLCFTALEWIWTIWSWTCFCCCAPDTALCWSKYRMGFPCCSLLK